MKFFFKSLVVMMLLVVGFFYYMGGEEPNVSGSTYTATNYNGLYSIHYSSSSSLCGEIGLQFKLLHQNNGLSNSAKMHKSNCRDLGNGNLEGYVFPKDKPNLRVFWQYRNGKVNYK
ncbi:hypothetical protein M0C34_09970 [Agarivorans sp. TSD2052]|uniref:hypothetical protein n=1 Tax=Agarivorans sp. TSD2052 TaxID=2937286 RepID=UPI00200BD0EC|nr:hypothetical protein [Agarivorans sp. TSD2052]UPW20553.1 hypothetical protein M0C34_09970 [Agarivorans sp. TSD2052]